MAMYSYIIGTAVQETKYFMAMCLIILVSFGSSLYVLDQTQQHMWEDSISPIWKDPEVDYVELTKEKTISEMVDSIFT
jgi:hypothetical protein